METPRAHPQVVVDSLSSFFYFAALFSKGLKLMLNWHFPYAHLACALPVRWRKPVQQNGAWVYPASTGPLLDAHSLVAALERYARTDVRNGSDPGPGSCYDVDEGAMAPYVNAASPLPGAPFYVETPAGGAPVQGLVVRALDAMAHLVLIGSESGRVGRYISRVGRLWFLYLSTVA